MSKISYHVSFMFEQSRRIQAPCLIRHDQYEAGLGCDFSVESDV